jgi:hypothetical protein
VPRVRDVLYRFRPAGTPGAASASGVPSDRRADAADELEPVLARLASTEHECDVILRRARQDAAEMGERDAEAARAITAAAAERASVERAAAAADVRRESAEESAAAVAAAQEEAARLHDRAQQRLPVFVDHIVGSIMTILDEGQRPAPPGGAT